MFDLLRITITDFKSYRGAHEFEFPKTVGLYFLTGDNKQEQALGANGAGKSTLLDAITWALFGRTTRGLKANEVLSWGATSCAVTLELAVGSKNLTIQRTQKPNGLLLNSKPVDQEGLQKHILLNYESFLYAVINTQFGESFLSLAPSAKLTLFADIMDLDSWLTRSDEAALISSNQEALIASQEVAIHKYESEIAAIEDDLEELTEQEAVFDDEKQNELKKIKAEIALVEDERIENLPKVSEALLVRLAKLEKRRDSRITHIQDAVRERSEFVGKLKALKEQIEEHEKLDGLCPVCNQAVDKQLHAAHLRTLLRKEVALVNAVSICDGDLDLIKKALFEIKHEIEILSEKINDVADTERSQQALRDEVKALKTKYSEAKAKANPYCNWLANKRTKLGAIIKWRFDSIALKEKLEAEHTATNYWIKGFKKVRLFIIEQAFQTLEVEVNNNLAQLGMPDWQITFDIERENKSGGITKGFVVFVQGPNNKEPVRWENWSGGETQRLQLAGDLGLANLIMQRHGLTGTIEFYDEPSTHLSKEGMMDLADMLHDRAINEGKRIWIVDHTSITNFGEFEGIITIRKDENGSSSITMDS